MDILRIQGRVVVNRPGKPATYAAVLITQGDVGGNFELAFDLEGHTIEDLPIEVPLGVLEGLHGAIIRALTSNAEVGLDVAQVR